MGASDRDTANRDAQPDPVERQAGADGAPASRLDLRGLKCPLPVLRTRKALGALQPGARIEVLADDPLAGVDIPNFVREAGEDLVEVVRLERGWRFLVGRRSS